MKLYIPKLGAKIVLTKDWQFTLMAEPRNSTLWEIMTDNPVPPGPWGVPFNQYFKPTTLVTLPKGTVLIFDRVYIRKGAEEHDSITFKGKVLHLGIVRSVRFWVLIHDANKINYEVLS